MIKKWDPFPKDNVSDPEAFWRFRNIATSLSYVRDASQWYTIDTESNVSARKSGPKLVSRAEWITKIVVLFVI